MAHKFYTKEPKVQKTIRLDANVLLWLEEQAEECGVGYQTHLNAILKDLMLGNDSLVKRLERIEKKLETVALKKAD